MNDRLVRAGALVTGFLGLKPQAESCCPFGAEIEYAFSETLPAHFRYYLVTTDAGGHWAAKKSKKLSIKAVAVRRLEKIELRL